MPSIVQTRRCPMFGLSLRGPFLPLRLPNLEIDHRPSPAQPSKSSGKNRRASSRQRLADRLVRFRFSCHSIRWEAPVSGGMNGIQLDVFVAGVSKLDVQANGPWKQLDDGINVTLEKVVPRLLGPLQEDGRSIKPYLIHSDLMAQKKHRHGLAHQRNLHLRLLHVLHAPQDGDRGVGC